MNRRRFLAAVGAGASATLAGCSVIDPSAAADDYDVGMTAEAFRPYEITVSVGDTVVWDNTSTRAHSVTAYEEEIPAEAEYFATGGFDSEAAAREAWDGNEGAITNGQRFSHTFEVAGDYTYFCIPHEGAGMVGVVRVEE
ncbi:plastocyanin/azurin family copper-binding protein [Halobaculum sp. CBA1158]|uniref:plastocyanin/azurin family copper-binding protein n=1 Tax=Halobaculum sp. CBA1158 TaxID=2904243 RepID=UPI001F48E0CE|nr:plastocyanin/azurin family copper-binding protein [Halobaculum sp. CBA1158]UIO98524.1 plastocyanin/azurin family copper-binding protein [Halobaculum sp. CBA1158]